MTEEQPTLMTLNQAAVHLGISEVTILMAIKKKKITPVKKGNWWYLDFNDVEKFRINKYVREENREVNGQKLFDKSKNRYSVRQVCEIFNVSKSRVYYCMRSKKINFFLEAATYVILIEDIDAFRKVIRPNSD